MRAEGGVAAAGPGSWRTPLQSQTSRRSCENIDFGFFRPRVFSYLQEKKSGFFNIFTASKPCLRHPNTVVWEG
jgi:hypothetical protein